MNPDRAAELAKLNHATLVLLLLQAEQENEKLREAYPRLVAIVRTVALGSGALRTQAEALLREIGEM